MQCDERIEEDVTNLAVAANPEKIEEDGMSEQNWLWRLIQIVLEKKKAVCSRP